MATMTGIQLDYSHLVQDDRVNGRVYYDPEIFRNEMERIWHREWVYVAHESEVPEPGDYVTRQIGLQPVIVSRDEDGKVHLLLNRCMHRGNTVCQSECGNAHAFRCAYHGWTYNNRGDLVGVPYAAGYDASFNKSEFALAKVPRVASHRGLIFASLNPDGPSLADHLGPAKRLIDQFVDLSPAGEVVLRSGVLKHSYKGNWKMALENAVDGYHPNILHHAAMVMMMKGKNDMEAVFGENSEARTRDWGHGVEQLDLNPVQTKNGGRVVTPGWSKQTFDDYQDAMTRNYGEARATKIIAEGPPHFCIFPNIIFILNQFRVIQPVSVNETVIYYYPTLLKDAPEEINRRRLAETYLIHGPAGRVAPDDFEAYERNQLGFQAQINEWLVLRRGLHRETSENGSMSGHETDETTQRGIWRHYRDVMTRLKISHFLNDSGIVEDPARSVSSARAPGRRRQGENMKFGIFMAPFHRVGENPALAFERDMQLIEWLDELGYDEAFIGEHHSAGWEIISSPEIFMAVAATRTKRIMLGSGVVSVPYHHPFNVANRFALLDQLTRGRVILGCGPGALPSDAYMLGIETTTQRDRMVEGIHAIQRLFTEDGGITIDGSYFKLRDAHLQVKPYQKPHLPIFVANTFSPSGMVAAGKLGCGVLSIATFAPGGMKDLPKRWAMGEEIAAENGKTLDRKNWRLVFPVHLADSKKEALDDIREGANTWIQKYFVETLAANIQFEEYPGQPTNELNIDRMVARGGMIVGTPDDAIQQIEAAREATEGGFGGLLILAHEWASREKTLRSYELWARYVAPHFQGTVEAIENSNRWTAERRQMLMGTSMQAIMKSMQDYKDSREAAGHKPSELADRPVTRIRP